MYQYNQLLESGYHSLKFVFNFIDFISRISLFIFTAIEGINFKNYLDENYHMFRNWNLHTETLMSTDYMEEWTYRSTDHSSQSIPLGTEVISFPFHSLA